jgi:hypothetical protein
VDPQLLEKVEEAAQQLGLVGEGAGARGVYLTCTSRLLADTALRLVRLGAPASGKNVVVECVLKLIPGDAVEQFSGTSPKALAYYGGDDPDALKGKTLYFPEASLLNDRRGEEVNEFATMLRTLISEGRLYHQTVRILGNKQLVTETIIKNGPIAVVLTTATDIDLELKTRVLVMETDESGEQTKRIAERILSQPQERPDLEPWLDLQKWLELDAPYRVHIPFRRAIFLAFEAWRKGFLIEASMRMRRDIGSLITAVEASAVLHRAQREILEDGTIVAELNDYRHAHEAFDAGLSAVHGKADAKVIATIEAVEAIRKKLDPGAGPDVPIKITVRGLAKQLRVGSLSTAKERLDAAIDYGAVEQDDTVKVSGKARYFVVRKASSNIKTAPGEGVFPPVEEVKRAYESQSAGANGPADEPGGDGVALEDTFGDPVNEPAGDGDTPPAEDRPQAGSSGAEEYI